MVFAVIFFVLTVIACISFVAAFVNGGMSQPSDRITSPQSGPLSGHDWFRPPPQCSFGEFMNYAFSNLTRADHCGLACWLYLLGGFQVILTLVYLVILLLCFVLIGYVLLLLLYVVIIPIAIAYLVLHLGTFIDFVAAVATGGPSVISAKAAASGSTV
jgi:hypothetical protein